MVLWPVRQSPCAMTLISNSDAARRSAGGDQPTFQFRFPRITDHPRRCSQLSVFVDNHNDQTSRDSRDPTRIHLGNGALRGPWTALGWPGQPTAFLPPPISHSLCTSDDPLHSKRLSSLPPSTSRRLIRLFLWLFFPLHIVIGYSYGTSTSDLFC